MSCKPIDVKFSEEKETFAAEFGTGGENMDAQFKDVGLAGASAYQIAVMHGFEGTEEDWLESLQGADGQPGKDGAPGKDGQPGAPGQDGKDFTYEDFTQEQLEALTGPAGKDGYTPQKGIDYFDGVDGKDGADGYTPQKGIDYFDGADGKDGEPGKDGYTPQKGVDYFDGKDGEPGKDGQPGNPGQDGFSPVVSVEDIDGGHRVTITDKNGAKTFDVMDGKDGAGGGGGSATAASVTLTVDGWVKTGMRYAQTVAVDGVTTDESQVIHVDAALTGTDLSADSAVLAAWGGTEGNGPASQNVAQGEGTLTFYCLEVPAVNIPVNVGVG